MVRRALCLIASVSALAACQDTPTETLAPVSARADLAAAAANAQAGAPIPGQYVVVFEEGVRDAPGLARQLAAAHGGSLLHTYSHALQGFAARLPEEALAAIERHPDVAYVEPDQVVHALGTQSGATWGIDRIDQRDLPLNDSYTYANDGSGVHAYIIDTGIRFSHGEFGGRAVSGHDAVDNDADASDCNGHGTHVAGTVGGGVYGVAKGVKLVGVRVLDCQGSGTVSGVIAGVDWVTANAVKPAVANMSLGGGSSTSLDDAVRNSISSGVTYAVAAGNGDMLGRPQDACAGSPSGVVEAITVGATDSTDVEASFSNYGTCVDLLAPGVKITAAWYTSDTDLNTISGTSMATPHVAGAAALYLHANAGASPQQVRDALVGNASQDRITLHSRSQTYGTPNLLLYTGFIGSGSGGTTNSPPTAAFSYSCTDLSCSFDGGGSTDSDGSIASYSWDFGDGATATGVTASHTYAAGGTYSVTLTVTDDAGASDSEAKSVSVSSSSGGSLALAATGYKVKGRWTTDLTWSGATSTKVDVYRDGSTVATTNNDGAHTDRTNYVGGGSLTYQVCEAGTTTCSNAVTVTF